MTKSNSLFLGIASADLLQWDQDKTRISKVNTLMLTLITTYLMKPMNDASTYATYFPSLHPQPTGHFHPTPQAFDV